MCLIQKKKREKENSLCISKLNRMHSIMFYYIRFQIYYIFTVYTNNHHTKILTYTLFHFVHTYTYTHTRSIDYILRTHINLLFQYFFCSFNNHWYINDWLIDWFSNHLHLKWWVKNGISSLTPSSPTSNIVLSHKKTIWNLSKILFSNHVIQILIHSQTCCFAIYRIL